MQTIDLNAINYDEKGLVPAVVQSAETQEVLMLAYMDEAAVQKTLETGLAHYYSRSRQTLWQKGETSGHTQTVQSMALDCDGDTILLQVIQKGPACHTNNVSCFYRALKEEPPKNQLRTLYDTIQAKRNADPESSYTGYLFSKGLDKMLKKVAEESGEVIIGAKNQDRNNMVEELADLVYHVLVVMVSEGITIDDVKRTLKERSQ